MTKDQNEALKGVRKTDGKLIVVTQTMEDINMETEVKEVLEDIEQSNGKKINMTNKRIDFDKKAMKRLETMLPVYKDEAGDVNMSELYSFVVRKAIDSLFENDFKKRLESL